MMWIYVLDVCLFGLALYFVRCLLRAKRAPLPPGPPGWPLIGNLLDIPKTAIHETFGAMSRKYGPIISLDLMGTRFIALNSSKVAKDVLEKRSAASSNRLFLTMGADLVGWGDTTAFLEYGETHRKHRKFLHHQIGTKSSLEAFHSSEEAEARQLIRNVVAKPDDLVAHCHRMAGAVILKISHGYTVEQDNDPLVKMANDAMDNLSVVTTPGRFLVDMLPILRYLPEWFPGGGFHKDARRWRKMLNKAAMTPYEYVKAHLARGDAAPSFTSRLLQEGVTPEDEDTLKWASFSMYLGGSDTTPATLSAFFLAMALYPHVLKKAQAEVDMVIGHERLPTVSDRDELPYVNAICMELLRWHVVVPTAMHLTTEDDVYDGHFIPKGTCVTANIWNILSDPNTYPDPDVFNPERFLGENQQPDPREACFGYGRRACPGAQLAEMTIFICVATASATLDVSKCIENGVECMPRYDVQDGIVRRIKPFRCKVSLRSEKAEGLLQG